MDIPNGLVLLIRKRITEHKHTIYVRPSREVYSNYSRMGLGLVIYEFEDIFSRIHCFRRIFSNNCPYFSCVLSCDAHCDAGMRVLRWGLCGSGC